MDSLLRVKEFSQRYITVEPVVFMYMSSMFLEMSIIPDLMLTKLCLQELNVTDYHECHNISKVEREQLTAELASWMGYYSMTMFFFAMITTTYIGSWSDRFSRKIPMFIPPVGSVFAVTTLIVNSWLINHHIGWILISGALSGVTGGIVGIVATTFGYIADITTVHNRTFRVVILEANIYVGGTIGMIVGGLVHKKLFSIQDLGIPSYTVIFFIELGLILLVILYIYFKVVDIPRPQQPSDSGQKLFYKLFNINHVKDSIATTLKRRENNHRFYILIILFASLIVNYTLSVQTTLNFAFVSGEPFHWTQPEYSYFTAVNFGVCGLSLLLGMPLFFHFFVLKDTTVACLGVASKMAGLILFGLSTTTTTIYFVPLLFLFSEFSIPALRSILSKLVDENEKGKIFALMQLIQNLSLLTGAQILNPLYKETQHIFKGLCYELVAALQLIPIFILIDIGHQLDDKTKPFSSKKGDDRMRLLTNQNGNHFDYNSLQQLPCDRDI